MVINAIRAHALRAMAAVAIAVPCAVFAAAQTDRAQETDALSRRAADRVQALRDEADRLTLEARTVLGDLRRLEIAREIAAEELRHAERDVAAVAAERAALDAQIAAIEQAEQQEAPALRARLVSLYKLGRGRYVRLLLSTSDVRRIGQASRVVAVLASQDRDRIATHQRRLEELTTSRRTLQDRQARLAVLRETAERARAAADKAVAARNALIAEIDRRRDLNAQLAGELLAAHQKLRATLAGMSSTSPPSLPIGPFRGDLDWPVVGTVRQRFGGPGDPSGAARTGVDIAASEGAPVQALHDGTVAFADVFTGFGRLVIVDHGGQTFSLYGNLRDIQAARGARVARGAPIGTVGVSPTGAAGLYFELRIDGRPVDPLQWLKRN
jgi:septal ring factor EnvC (AmiA/AmiB activator)